MAGRRRAADNKETAMPPGEIPPVVAEVIAKLARIEAATARIEEQLNEVLAELASLRRPAARPAPPHPMARHALSARRTCRGHQPRLRGAQQCARFRRDH
jgi:hypothetical protein